MPTRAIRTPVTQWTPGIKPTWKIAEVRTALRLHAEGDFSQSALLVDSMGEDDALPGVIEKLIDSVLKSDFELQPVEAPNAQLSKRLVKEFEPLWWDIFPEAELDDLLRWYRMLGVGLAVLDWERGGNRWNARVRVLHPQFLRRDTFNGKWLYQAREGELEVTPGDGKWILLTDGQRGWMRSSMRALAVTWIAKQLTIRDWNRYNERHGLPIVKAMAPAIADESDNEAFWEDLKDIHGETVAQLPTHLGGTEANREISYDLQLLEATDRSWETFRETLARCDRRFMVHILGANLSTEQNDQGSRAASETHRGVERQKASAIATKTATELRRQGLYPITAYNVAAVTIDVVPWPHWDTEPPEDTLAEATDQKTFGEALAAVQTAGFDIQNLDELAEKHGLKLVKRKIEEPPAEPGKPEPNQDEEPEEESDEDGPEPENVRALAAADTKPDQAYADRIVKRIASHGAKELALTIASLIAAVSQAQDYDEARQMIADKYAHLAPPNELATLTEAALTMAQMGGRLGVREELPELED